MGVYIKGMEMPKDYSVVVKIFPDGRVGTVPYIQWFKVDLIPGTKAVSVPPHGDLIDRDAVRDGIDRVRPGRSYEDAWALTVLDHATTIIHAEEQDMKEKPIWEQLGYDPDPPFYSSAQTPIVTHYDQLIRKTPEEMAAFLADHPVVSTFSPDNPHHKEWLDWLKQPAAEE